MTLKSPIDLDNCFFTEDKATKNFLDALENSSRDRLLKYFFFAFNRFQRNWQTETRTMPKAVAGVMTFAMRSAMFIHAPSKILQSAVHYGVLELLIVIRPYVTTTMKIAMPDNLEELPPVDIIKIQRKIVTSLNDEHETFLKAFLKERLLSVNGVPGGCCVVGFDARLPPLGALSTKADGELLDDEEVLAYIFSEQAIVALVQGKIKGEEIVTPTLMYLAAPPEHEGYWVSPLSGEGFYMMHLLQAINIAFDKATRRTGLQFKRVTEKLSRIYGVRTKLLPPYYEIPADIQVPEHELRSQLKIPGLKHDKTEQVSVRVTRNSVVEYYMKLRHAIEFYSGTERGRQNPHSTLIVNGLRHARLFEIPTELYLGFYHQAERYVTEQVVGVEWEKHEEDEEWMQDRMTAVDFVQCVNESGTHLPLPEKQPFDCYYFAYNPPPVLNETMYSIYNLNKVTETMPIKSAEILGQLVYGDFVGTFLILQLYNGKTTHSFCIEHDRKEWLMPYTLAPWIVTALIDWINDHQTVVQDDSTLSHYRQGFKKITSQLHMTRDAPPAYYTVYMRDLVINKSVRKTFSSRFKKIIDWSHRWEVRGHYMVRVKRGTTPLDPKLEKVLRKRKYQIYTEENPPFDVWQKLEARGIPPKKANEWLAVLVTFRHDFVKGPEDKPLVPSVRKSARYADEGEERSLFDDQDIDETIGD